MSICCHYHHSMSTELTLADLAEASGLHPRTIRSWVAQDILPGPLSRGPSARYPADMLDRVLTVRALKESGGVPLGQIRQFLLIASPTEIAAQAAIGAKLAPEPAGNEAGDETKAPMNDALDYLRALRRQTPMRVSERAAVPYGAKPKGFEALEQQLSSGGSARTPDRKSRTEAWLKLSITPDIELSVRGALDPDQRARLERCADLIRDILQGRAP